MTYAADVLAEHPLFAEATPPASRTTRYRWAIGHLTAWEDAVVEMDWPGDNAIDQEQWHRTPDWRLLDYMAGRADREAIALPASDDTSEVMRAYLNHRIAQCQAQQQDPDQPTDGSRP
ncbi:hypothetical protein ACFVVA_36905 [Kitasatospora sp. NPDC058048]|uniref:hypothetical protein n=1 Tax=Kitasatospora sp. NPDC058048 TaxID=3346313 RepID=UPI0036DAF776